MSSKFQTAAKPEASGKMRLWIRIAAARHSLRPLKLFYKEFLAASQRKG